MTKNLARKRALLGLLIAAVAVAAGVRAGVLRVADAPRHLEAAAARQEGAYQAGVVVRFSDDRVVTQCVSFDRPSVSGAELLQLSGLNPGIHTDGRVCSVDNAGCAVNDCWCRCPFPECEYWAYYYLENGAWVYSQAGAGWREVQNGAVQGWSWGPGNFTEGVEPPSFSFDQICSVRGRGAP